MHTGYPTRSFLYLDHDEIQPLDPGSAPLKLRIAIVGAGVAGLSAAIALRRNDHDVTVFESTSALSEIGAGINTPPNSTRILHSWGLEPALREVSRLPHAMLWRRWESGEIIGNGRLNPLSEEWFGSPYLVIHRAHLHNVLHQKAVDLGVKIRLSSRVHRYNLEEPSFVLMSGENVKADLVIAADGVKSLARETMLDPNQASLHDHGMAVYRTTVAVEEAMNNPRTAALVESQSTHIWVGDSRHVIAYKIAREKLLNLVVIHPAQGEPEDWIEQDHAVQMRQEFEGWDPTLVAILQMAKTVVRWPLRTVTIPDSWSSKTRRTLLIGDAAHAMLPFMGSGAAVAVEDAEALAAALRHVHDEKMIAKAIDVFESVQIPRAKQVQEASLMHGYTMHLPDGLDQQRRDKAMEKEVKGEHFLWSPNQWSDPTTVSWLYSYKVTAEIERVWLERL